MSNKSKKIQKIVTALMIIAIILPAVLFSRPKQVSAQTVDPVNAVMGAIRNVFLGTSTASTVTDTGFSIKNFALEILKETLRAIGRKALQGITQSTIKWINTGYYGNPLFLENPKSFFKDVAKYEIKNVVDAIGYNPSKYPFGKDFALNIINSYNTQAQENAQYSLSKVMQDPVLLKSYREDFSVGGWNGFLINTQYQQNNYLGFQMLETEKLAKKLENKVDNNIKKVQEKLNQGMGFLSPQICPSNQKYNNLKNEFKKPTFKETEFDPPPEPVEPTPPTGYEEDPEQAQRDYEIAYQEYLNSPEKGRYDLYVENWERTNDVNEENFNRDNTCPGGLVNTTPGSVVANQITKALGATQDQTSLAAAMGNSISAILDTLISKLMSKGLNALASTINRPPEDPDTWDYYGNKLGSPADANSAYGSGPDKEIIIADFKKLLNGKTIVITSQIKKEEIGNTGNGTYIPGDIANTKTELKLISNDVSSSNPTGGGGGQCTPPFEGWQAFWPQATPCAGQSASNPPPSNGYFCLENLIRNSRIDGMPDSNETNNNTKPTLSACLNWCATQGGKACNYGYQYSSILNNTTRYCAATFGNGLSVRNYTGNGLEGDNTCPAPTTPASTPTPTPPVEITNGPGIIQVVDKTWPKIRELDMCLPGPDVKWESRLDQEFQRNSTTITEEASDGDADKAALAQLTFKSLQYAVASYKDWVKTKMITSLPSAITYMDAIDGLEALQQEAKELADAKRLKVQALARLEAIRDNLNANFTEQPKRGTEKEKDMIKLWKEYKAVEISIANTISIENRRSELAVANDEYNKINSLVSKCVAERAAKGWTEPDAISGYRGSTMANTTEIETSRFFGDRISNNDPEQRLFCDGALKNGYSHESFINREPYVSYPDIPLVNGEDVLLYGGWPGLKWFGAAFPGTSWLPFSQKKLDINLECGIIYPAHIFDYKGDLPGPTTIRDIPPDGINTGGGGGECSEIPTETQTQESQAVIDYMLPLLNAIPPMDPIVTPPTADYQAKVQDIVDQVNSDPVMRRVGALYSPNYNSINVIGMEFNYLVGPASPTSEPASGIIGVGTTWRNAWRVTCPVGTNPSTPGNPTTPTPGGPVTPGGTGTITGTLSPSSGINIVNAPSDVLSWPETTQITNIDFSGPWRFDFSKKDGSGRWSDQFGGPGIAATDTIQYTVWLFLKINNQWVGSGFIQMWHDRIGAGGSGATLYSQLPTNWYYGTAWSPMTPGNAPLRAGDQIGFMVTSGNSRNGGVPQFKERSNIVLVTLSGGNPSSTTLGSSPIPNGDTRALFNSLVANRPFGQQTLLNIEPALGQYCIQLTPPNSVGDRTKIGDPISRRWIRVGFGEGQWVWVVQSDVYTPNCGG